MFSFSEPVSYLPTDFASLVQTGHVNSLKIPRTQSLASPVVSNAPGSKQILIQPGSATHKANPSQVRVSKRNRQIELPPIDPRKLEPFPTKLAPLPPPQSQQHVGYSNPLPAPVQQPTQPPPAVQVQTHVQTQAPLPAARVNEQDNQLQQALEDLDAELVEQDLPVIGATPLPPVRPVDRDLNEILAPPSQEESQMFGGSLQRYQNIKDLKAKTVKELRNLCKQYGLKTSGNREDLEKRLLQ